VRLSPIVGCSSLAQRYALRKRCTREGTLVLSYDDGPGTRLTPKLLDSLAEWGARATFFPLGSRAEVAPDVLNRMSGAGHEVGCHGHSHVNARVCPPGGAERDIELGYSALAPWVDPTALFRPPYGKLSAESARALRRRGVRVGWWTIDSGDALLDRPSIDPVVHALDRAGGGVVVMHDFDRDPPEPERERFVLDLTSALLELAGRRGWRVATLGEILV
jgi:peptidoglycan-N-acetylglucosamine deacetylase